MFSIETLFAQTYVLINTKIIPVRQISQEYAIWTEASFLLSLCDVWFNARRKTRNSIIWNVSVFHKYEGESVNWSQMEVK
jgi:hypothetical protein